MSSCLTLGNELSEKTHVLTKQKMSWRRGAQAESSTGGNPGELLCHVAHSLRFYGNGVSLQVVSGQLSCVAGTWSGSGSFLVERISQPRWIPAPRILGGRFLPSLRLALPKFSVSFLSSTMFPGRASCCETTHASGYYHASPRRSSFTQWFPNRCARLFCSGGQLHTKRSRPCGQKESKTQRREQSSFQI